MKVGCAKEMTVSTGKVEEAAALELASLCRLVLFGNVHQSNSLQRQASFKSSFAILFLGFC